MSAVLNFLKGEQPDIYGRYIYQIWKFSPFQQEYTHNYIQWLFPLGERRANEQYKPILSLEEFEQIKQSPIIQNHLFHSLDFMLAYWGIKRNGTQVSSEQPLDKELHRWIKPYNHNQLRISRVIRCLWLCGQQELALNFQAFVIKIGHQWNINSQTMKIWQTII